MRYGLNCLINQTYLSKYPALTKLKRQLQVPKAYGALGLAGLFSIFVFFNLFGGFLTTTLGWGLPAYFSIQALQSPSSGDDVQWLTYWNIKMLTKMGQLETAPGAIRASLDGATHHA
ncbi:uncharacterized protein PGTG_03846 [Puccinia graminis f. sp. tritici CRL 75-36-700-3]|uniref:Protein YOP1 n=1 Tax=Puccinia graminis f. sp. tritici (strain CRL 75-36-700-3 / race SCCL) TaxID=418459 RepID=E3K0R5_PUCGT|nr:uncharacterized protein PGTG_03846 [Puccinia graminis f. sp. tritici CRL 75-36-700-3]EFP77890.1 hypothetical protein PGTG_03846 [Puccinia graminis f. sp. tritici CRL 75-36-700-3]